MINPNTETTLLTIAAMHEYLSTGVPLQLQLTTQAEAEKLRLRILQVKSRKERLTREVIGKFNGEDQLIFVLSMSYNDHTHTVTYSYNKSKKTRASTTVFSVVLRDDVNTLAGESLP